jgi:acetyl-CoA carboxylase carboxyl transferase subunit alpha
LGGAHRNYDVAAENVRDNVLNVLEDLQGMNKEELLQTRYQRLMELGRFEDKNN